MEFDVSGICWGVLLIVYRGEIITIGNLLLSAHGYQLLPLATSQWLITGNFSVLLIVGEGDLETIEDQSLSTHSYQLLPLATS